jgi:hypothetical protein
MNGLIGLTLVGVLGIAGAHIVKNKKTGSRVPSGVISSG